MQPVTGLVRCDWGTALTLRIDQTDVSGLYALKLIRKDGLVRFVPLVIVDDRPADLLFQASVHTYLAYNAWGGDSLYPGGADRVGVTGTTQGVEVSYDRPYDSLTGAGQALVSRVSDDSPPRATASWTRGRSAHGRTGRASP